MNRMYAKTGVWVLAGVVVVGVVVFSLPKLLAVSVQNEQKRAFSAMSEQFPVTVDPKNKTIVENALVNAYFDSATSSYQAAVGNTKGIFEKIFEWIALSIAEAPWYQNLAAVGASRFVTITPGMRKEQVAAAFGSVLDWNATQKKEFMTASKYSSLPFSEGSFSPGLYSLDSVTSPRMVQAMVNDRFGNEILDHYGTTTAQVVPLNQALTIASLIEREAGGPDDMRIISGIIWNRLFINMPLQLDATLQYVKANTTATNSWWPSVVPADRYRKSPYNTYQHPGLPPTPIASPSVASVLAALNPVKTSCLFYFHDAGQRFHCSDTYAGHVALIKKYYGRGK